MCKLFTAGYTLFAKYDQHQDFMVNTLKQCKVNLLIDVRSVPYSRKYSQFNSNRLAAGCSKHGLRYVHVPELGGKVNPNWDVFSKAIDVWNDPNVFTIPYRDRPEWKPLYKDELIVDFNKLVSYTPWLKVMGRLGANLKQGDTVCLLCAEDDPIDCHRYFLISKVLEANFPELEIQHFAQGTNGSIVLANQKQVDAALRAKMLNKFPKTKHNNTDQEIFRLNNLLHGWKK